jgi:mannose-6-phosphate isomerase-like protein (cupin superfamily)
MRLPSARDVVAPDGSDVRVLLQLARGSTAHFELGTERVSRAVAHHSVDEIWYVVRGSGQMWRREADREETVDLEPGTCVSIPAGTHFQFRSTGDGPLAVIAVTMPPGQGRTRLMTYVACGVPIPSANRCEVARSREFGREEGESSRQATDGRERGWARQILCSGGWLPVRW